MKKDITRTLQARHKIFKQIELLLDEKNLDDITFSQIARMCGCQPNSVSYYFQNKMDMLLQFTKYFLEKDTLYQLSLNFAPSDLDPVEGFCLEIDKIFLSSEKKSKIRLLSNQFLITNAAQSADFKQYLNNSFQEEISAYRHMIDHYDSLGILCQDRLHNSCLELYFQASAFSILYIFQVPVCDYQVQIHNVKEQLKDSFLKDHLYTAQYLDPVIPPANLTENENNLKKDFLRPEITVSELQKEVYKRITFLLSHDRMADITFSYLAEHCYCQTSSIAYYFDSKMDMLLQFTRYHLQEFYSVSADSVYTPPSGLSDIDAFRLFVASALESPYERSKVIYWINHIVICNAPVNSDFYDYLRFSIQRKFQKYWNIIRYYNEKGILEENRMKHTYYDLCFFSDTIALLEIFQIPIVEKDHFVKCISNRLLESFLKKTVK